MSTQVDTVRLLISDFPLYVSATSLGDSFTTEFVFPYAPVITGSMKVYLNKTVSTTGFTVDPDLGVVTFTNPLADGVSLDLSARATLLTDAQIQTILDLYPDSDNADAAKLAAADCLDIIASAEALIQKKIKMLDYEIDGPALARSLRDNAKSLRDQVLNSEESSFEIIEQVNNVAGWREKITKDWMRGL